MSQHIGIKKRERFYMCPRVHAQSGWYEEGKQPKGWIDATDLDHAAVIRIQSGRTHYINVINEERPFK